MRYRITAKVWASALNAQSVRTYPVPRGYDSWEAFDAAWAPQFPASELGNNNEIHDLTDGQVIDLIIRWGRASIEEGPDGIRTLCFENDYD
jgi:hypothetical protein